MEVGDLAKRVACAPLEVERGILASLYEVVPLELCMHAKAALRILLPLG